MGRWLVALVSLVMVVVGMVTATADSENAKGRHMHAQSIAGSLWRDGESFYAQSEATVNELVAKGEMTRLMGALILNEMHKPYVVREMRECIVTTLENLYSEEDLKVVDAFYTSPAGVRWLKTESKRARMISDAAYRVGEEAGRRAVARLLGPGNKKEGD